ncbi:ribonucleoside-diphosphate reductase subunit alpha [Bacillus chungangensis]|uniref:Ribonucleoside-diphosphate reductase n=1 Tax=Bacillus chungangensis TaxID=587633 RepID=A0ABT9WNF2_9BACI|nr:ribonucleoside-diphosphate reductase subunit alpha [Bacillus chungangensis]MDQ0174315.1 ribonucleoside-diphosphate reductase alpha chain [Bacillus chungangensis]
MTTIITKNEGKRRLPFDQKRLEKFIDAAVVAFPHIQTDAYKAKIVRTITQYEEYKATEITNLLILTALENIDISDPDWTYVAAKVYLQSLYKQASRNRAYEAAKKYGDFYGLLKILADKGVYSPNILAKYSREEIVEMAKIIDPSCDHLFTYVGLRTLADRYLATDYHKHVYELPQERWLVIALYLMQDEPKNKRLDLVKETYWALSQLYMTVATPTLANAGKSHGQLSSCFIDTVEDSLIGIYNSNTDVARLSKDGGGIGVYLGKVRARGSAIKGYVGASSGVIPWMKQLNNTAVSVDQLGTRKGAIAVYLDIWHADIMSFLDVKLNNGDERQRTHDLFHGVCIPDLFMEQVERRGDWYIFDPHEVRRVMGYSLEDFYDEEIGKGSFRERYDECVRNNDLKKTKVPAIDIMKRLLRSQLETGGPFMFYRDEVNRKNNNKHAGMVYCSNLCTEISQNQTPTEQLSEVIEGDEIIIRKKAGDFVVCNLSSVNLGRAVPDNVMERLIPIQVRMLDNVIDLNTIDVKQARITNNKYRAIGLGTFGWHHLLALKGIAWESDAAVQLADELYEEIAYLTIKASVDLAKEKGAYPKFAGSDWQTGEYFVSRQYINSKEEIRKENEHNTRWHQLAYTIQQEGIRNGYLLAIAPNASTSIIAGSSASIDPIFDVMYTEEKKDYRIPVTAPDLSHETYDVYRKTAYKIDQFWSIKQNAARQRHIDQAISFNFYVPNFIRASVLLELHMQAWKNRMKTTYYVRSTATAVEDCEWCQS